MVQVALPPLGDGGVRRRMQRTERLAYRLEVCTERVDLFRVLFVVAVCCCCFCFFKYLPRALIGVSAFGGWLPHKGRWYFPSAARRSARRRSKVGCSIPLPPTRLSLRVEVVQAGTAGSPLSHPTQNRWVCLFSVVFDRILTPVLLVWCGYDVLWSPIVIMSLFACRALPIVLDFITRRK